MILHIQIDSSVTVGDNHGRFWIDLLECIQLRSIHANASSRYGDCGGRLDLFQFLNRSGFSGKERGHSLLNKSDQIYLYFGLPSIPVVLILFKFVRWEDQLLKLWLQTELSMFGSKSDAEHYDEIAEQHLAVSYSTESTSICRDLCSALILPTAATFFGKLLFSSVESNLNRTILVSTVIHFGNY